MVLAVGCQAIKQLLIQGIAIVLHGLQYLGHLVDVVQYHHVRHQMVVFDHLALLMAYVFGNNPVAAKEQPLHEIIERLAFVGGGMDGFPKFHIVNILEQEQCTVDPAQFPECIIQLVLAAGCPQAPKDR